MFDFRNLSNKLVVDKMKDETAGVAAEEIVGLKAKVCKMMCRKNV